MALLRRRGPLVLVWNCLLCLTPADPWWSRPRSVSWARRALKKRNGQHFCLAPGTLLRVPLVHVQTRGPPSPRPPRVQCWKGTPARGRREDESFASQDQTYGLRPTFVSVASSGRGGCATQNQDLLHLQHCTRGGGGGGPRPVLPFIDVSPAFPRMSCAGGAPLCLPTEAPWFVAVATALRPLYLAFWGKKRSRPAEQAENAWHPAGSSVAPSTPRWLRLDSCARCVVSG